VESGVRLPVRALSDLSLHAHSAVRSEPMYDPSRRMKTNAAGIAQLVERHVANVKVAGSNPVSRLKEAEQSLWFGAVAQLG
jgi:hypothetical protein